MNLPGDGNQWSKYGAVALISDAIRGEKKLHNDELHGLYSPNI